MSRAFGIVLFLLCSLFCVAAPRTMRVDYYHAGNSQQDSGFLAELTRRRLGLLIGPAPLVLQAAPLGLPLPEGVEHRPDDQAGHGGPGDQQRVHLTQRTGPAQPSGAS